MKKIKLKQILALLAVFLLAGMYVACLVLALIHSEWATRMLGLTLVLTILVPVTLYILMMFYKLSHRKDTDEE